VGFQTVAPCRRRLDSRNAVFQHDVMHRMLEAQAGQPSPVHQRPRRTFVVMALAQQKAGQLLTGLTQRPHCRLARPHQIASSISQRISFAPIMKGGTRLPAWPFDQ
jgi:hypothetical protein